MVHRTDWVFLNSSGSLSVTRNESPLSQEMICPQKTDAAESPAYVQTLKQAAEVTQGWCSQPRTSLLGQTAKQKTDPVVYLALRLFVDCYNHA